MLMLDFHQYIVMNKWKEYRDIWMVRFHMNMILKILLIIFGRDVEMVMQIMIGQEFYWPINHLIKNIILIFREVVKTQTFFYQVDLLIKMVSIGMVMIITKDLTYYLI